MDNFKLCYSWGGLHDDRINWGAPVCYIKGKGLYCPEDAPVINLNSGDDYKFITSGKSFAIPYH
jgi:hypothetical protein